jgi:hypothetical protein
MTRVMLGIAIAALAIGAGLDGNIGEARAAEAWRCSQRYFAAHATCVKRSSQAQCDRVLGARQATCMKTGCWRTTRTNKCGYTRL